VKVGLLQYLQVAVVVLTQVVVAMVVQAVEA
jgi:hypothetical protein